MTEPTQQRSARREERREKVRRAVHASRVVIASAAIVVLGGFLLVGCGSEPAAGRVTPDLELTTVDGEPVALSDYLGRPVAVTFMHSY